ncbi:WD40 repeat domain-containing serine/threonine protein kinase [Streptomyces alanosinicus]|uniref:WD40 repeat domain-containing serine/threonine protein kinase n=1 Tax=Streptomyces alanosinicus TaxID=68171 RepID=UPI00227D7AD4|nr:serine/threonine-protein kinase [Streptomyces alanosinicus]
MLAGRYELVGLVGRGGMGEVWEGRDRVIERRVAVKLLPLAAGDASGADLFFREARTAGALNHSGVVTVFDLGQDETDGSLFLVMEFLEGRDLASVLRADGLPPVAAVVGWGVQAMAALARAHGAGVVHRDLKPANLMLTPDGQVKILDFGIARFMESTKKSSKIMGTLAYMPPERFEGHPGDARSDLYSFGCVLSELLTGRPPFDADDPVGMMSAHLRHAPAPPGRTRPGIPGALGDLVLALLAKQPDDRPATAAEVADRLSAIHRALLGQPDAGPDRPPASAAAVAAPAVFSALPTETATPRPIATPSPAIRPAPGSRRPARYTRLGAPLTTHARNSGAVAFSPDGSLLATAGTGGAVLLWDSQTRRPVGEPLASNAKRIFTLAFSPDGSLLAAAPGGPGRDRVMLWNVRTRKAIGELIADSEIAKVAFSPGGSLLATGGNDGVVLLWDPTARQRVGPPLIANAGQIWAMAFSPDGSLLATGGKGGAVSLWDTATRHRVTSLAVQRRTRWLGRRQTALDGGVFAMAFSPDGSVLATGGIREVLLWDPVTGGRVTGWRLFVPVTAALAFSPDGSLLATADWGGAVQLWDRATRKPVDEFRDHNGMARAVAFSPDGSLLASAGDDGTVPLYARLAP